MKKVCLLLLVSVLEGCAQYTDKRGVEVTWQPEVIDSFTVGKTTRSEVLKALGPPSQVIALDGETVLYYLYEKLEGEGYILFVYNRFDVETRYDRAIFFFDAKEVLTEAASHISADVD